MIICVFQGQTEKLCISPEQISHDLMIQIPTNLFIALDYYDTYVDIMLSCRKITNDNPQRCVGLVVHNSCFM